MKRPSTASSCPACGHPVLKRLQGLEAFDHYVLPLMEIPFWIIFAACVALGVWHWFAGIVAVAAVGAIFFLWRREITQYECVACHKQVSYRESIR